MADLAGVDIAKSGRGHIVTTLQAQSLGMLKRLISRMYSLTSPDVITFDSLV